MVWLGSYCVGMIILIVGTIVFFVQKKQNKEQHAMLYLLFSMFLAMVIWYIPIETSLEEYSLPEGILSAIFQGIDALTGGGYSKNITNASWEIEQLFSLSIMIIRLLIVCLTFGVVASAFGKPYQYLINFFHRKRKTLILYGVNEKTLNIAKSESAKAKLRVIFCSDGDVSPEAKESVRELNGICFDKDISYVLNKVVKDCKRYTASNPVELFVFSDCEEDNLKCLSEVYSVLCNDERRNTRIYVEVSKTSWDIQNNLQKRYNTCERIIVNFVRTEENFAYNNLFSNPIFENAPIISGEKIIKLLVIGMDSYSLEMFKCMMWLGQLPGYKLHVKVIDNALFISRMRYLFPGLEQAMDEDGKAIYEVEFHEGVALSSAEFDELLNAYSDFNFAFVNTGSDIENYNIAMHLCTVRKRQKVENTCRIQVKSKEMNLFRSSEDITLNENSGEGWNCIYEVGTVEQVYSYQNITNSVIENVAKQIHYERQQKKAEAERQAWNAYCKDEYMRKSTYARALNLYYKICLIQTYYDSDYSLLEKDEVWIKYEHMRWNVYMWMQGYIYADKKDLRIAKTHPDIKAFCELSVKTRQYDRIEINEDIIKIFSE